jgi:hypothetical protein
MGSETSLKAFMVGSASSAPDADATATVVSRFATLLKILRCFFSSGVSFGVFAEFGC